MPRRAATSPAVRAATPSPTLFIWGARTLFLGQALGLIAHRNAVAVLCTGVDAPFEVARDPRRPAEGTVACRTTLIPANSLHHLHCGDTLMALLYVDAQSDDYRRLAASMAIAQARFVMQHANEVRYLEVLAALREGRPWRDARVYVISALGLDAPHRADARIAATLKLLREHPDRPHGLNQVAQRAKLSPSRFRHLIKMATGVPFRRYKLWVRMGPAVREMSAGRSLTEAALAAGFASSSHFSAAFREMFGLSPSRLTEARMTLQGAQA